MPERDASGWSVDLDAYCKRIGYSGPLTPTLETLRALHRLHPASIPFENVDVLLDRGVDIAPAAVEDKLIGRGRGGYCYEHNGLFKRVLAAIGFDVEGLAGRVWWGVPEGDPARPRTHMALRVTIDGIPWLADVGFGGCVPTAPLRMDSEEPQPTPLERFRIRPSGRELAVEVEIEGEWQRLYELSTEPMLDVDYQLGNWFVSANPASRFRHSLVAALTTPEARYGLLNSRLTIHSPTGSERRLLDTGELKDLLRERFGLPVEEDWTPLLERLVKLDQSATERTGA